MTDRQGGEHREDGVETNAVREGGKEGERGKADWESGEQRGGVGDV